MRLEQNISTEQKALIIYVKRRKKYDYVIKSREEAELVKAYLKSIYLM